MCNLFHPQHGKRKIVFPETPPTVARTKRNSGASKPLFIFVYRSLFSRLDIATAVVCRTETKRVELRTGILIGPTFVLLSTRTCFWTGMSVWNLYKKKKRFYTFDDVIHGRRGWRNYKAKLFGTISMNT